MNCSISIIPKLVGLFLKIVLTRNKKYPYHKKVHYMPVIYKAVDWLAIEDQPK